MILNKNYFNQIDIPPYILTKANGEKIGYIRCIDEQRITLNLEVPEISFKTYRYIDNELNDIYDKLSEMKYINVPNIGNFVISSVSEEDDGINPSKTVTAKSEEYNLSQRYLEEFYINNGETYSIDEVTLYNTENTDKSLLHLVLSYSPDWGIGYVNEELATATRRFEITSTDVYSFLTNDLEEYFEATVTFDSLNHLINVYSEDEFGNDTGIYVSYTNLLNNASLSSSIDEIKTCMTVIGEDDADLREVNIGTDKLYNIDYFATEEYMSSSCINCYNNWKTAISDNKEHYTQLSQKNKELYSEINRLTSEMMPDDLTSTDWNSYCLVLLQEKLNSYKDQQAVMIKAGQSDFYNKDYAIYLSVYNNIVALEEIYIPKRESEIKELEKEQEAVQLEIQGICKICSLEYNFPNNQLKEIVKFIRSETLSTDKYVITDTMTNDERVEMLQNMMEYGEKELKKKSQPQIDFSATILNLFSMDEFKNECVDFNCGNYIYVLLRDDYNVKARITSISINFLSIDDFSITFSNVHKTRTKTIFTDITNAIAMATKAAKTVERNSNRVNDISKNVNGINSILDNGIISDKSVSNSSDFLLNNSGMTLTNLEYPQDRIFIGGSNIVVSEDGMATTKTIIGRVEYEKDGEMQSKICSVSDYMKDGYINDTTMVVGGENNGVVIIRDENNNEINRIDKNGIQNQMRIVWVDDESQIGDDPYTIYCVKEV